MNASYPVHYPKDSNKFEFDEEVSNLFTSMAVRSIPMYAEVHRLHVSLMDRVINPRTRPHFVVYDIGASRGNLFKQICHQLSVGDDTGLPYFNFVAVDSSEYMLSKLSREMPWVRTVCTDALQLPDFVQQADVISMLYFLQFIKDPKDKEHMLRWAHRNLKPGGMLILGQKEEPTDTYSSMFSKEYYMFRERNGYSKGEIEAKTQALRNSMWPSSPAWAEDQCYRAGFIDYTETTRWLQFSTSICTKGDA